MIPIELLAPAKNADFGKAAILHGADALYIGAAYSARAGASNSIGEIEELIRFARKYRVKVYAVLNTLIYDHELEDVLRLINRLYEAGTDALIIQDMGLLKCALPPVPLFASTQTHNVSPEKIMFLEQVGFKRVILARELNLSQIEEIRKVTAIELECFVHGALCVSYSGQCYMSHAITGRSGNRGVCAQPCRSLYRLSDKDGNILVKDAHLLSLKDLNLSEYLSDMIHAGVTSFKIEGRLKDINYLKNITAFYRKKLDHILESDKKRVRSSSGKTVFHFIPDPDKTFNRGYTDYFITGRKGKIASPLTQKSIGEKIGVVTHVYPQSIIVRTQHEINNGDGLCWIDPYKGLTGLLVNKSEGNKVFPAKPVHLDVGTTIFRNNDFRFEKLLSGHSSDRTIAVSFRLSNHLSGYKLTACDEDGCRAEYYLETEKIPAKDPVNARNQIDTQLRKLGNTIFSAADVDIDTPFDYFIPAAVLNEMRRETVSELEKCRINSFAPERSEPVGRPASYPSGTLDYRGNVSNSMARQFYQEYGVASVEPAFELQKDYTNKVLMTTKYCIRYQYGMCPLKQASGNQWGKELFLRDARHTYRLEFDCKACEMKVITMS